MGIFVKIETLIEIERIRFMKSRRNSVGTRRRKSEESKRGELLDSCYEKSDHRFHNLRIKI